MTSSFDQRLHRALAVVGPTGSGKTALAIALAEHFNGEIVNCDSLQLYRHLDIGTAKPSFDERARVPHHLLDIVNPDEVFTAGDYVRLARPLMREVAERGALPVMVGGTGFYYRALVHGLFAGPGKDETLRERLARRPDRLHRLLRRLDPTMAERIHPNDAKKLIRALEVCLLARRPMSTLQQEQGRDRLEGFEIVTIGLDPPRELLAQRLNQRTAEMFERGLVQEVDRVLSMGFPPESKAFEAIGYREALLYRKGDVTLNEAVELAQIATRQYAKRQRTWFRKESGVHWIQAFGNQTETIETAIRLEEELTKKV